MQKVRGMVLLVALFIFVVSVNAQTMMTPAVEVADQVVLDGTVTIDRVVTAGPGFIVIHMDNNGTFGPVIGQRLLSVGENINVRVPIDASRATSTLYAMLHVDDNALGVYEFGTVQGADAPVIVDGAPLSPAFSVAVLNVKDQFLTDGTYTAASVTMETTGWLVIHADADGRPGPVVGQTFVEPGITTDVTVEITGEHTTLWPMLHVDTGEAGVYEFGAVQGADAPVVVGGVVATTQVFNVPHVRVEPQIVLRGDAMMTEDGGALTVTALSVLSEGDGWLVIHSEADGGPGPVAGFAPVSDGLNENVVVELDPALVTPNLWPMLHTDSGVLGTYEFGEVQGEDLPVRVNDRVVTFQIAAAPSIVYEVTNNGDGTLSIPQALIDAPGWMVIHIDNNGGPGPVIGFAPLTPGLNTDIVITVDVDALTPTVFPMLHYDTGEAGVYEFGEVQGEDLPVRVGGVVITGPAEVMGQ